MKQYITSLQLLELTGKARKKLRSWCVEKGYLEKDLDGVSLLVPLSIGQMIEFLDEHFELLDIIKGQLSNGWYIEDRIKKEPKRAEVDGELCDALWEAVKEVLNGKSN